MFPIIIILFDTLKPYGTTTRSTMTDGSNRLNYIITLSSTMTSIALDSSSICSGGCAFSSGNRVVAGKSTLSSFKLLQKNDRRDPLNPGHALSATSFSYTIFHAHTNTSDDESEIEFTTFSGLAKDSNVYTVYIYMFICVFIRIVYTASLCETSLLQGFCFGPGFLWGPDSPCQLFRTTPHHPFIFSRPHTAQYVYGYIYIHYIRVRFRETFRPSG